MKLKIALSIILLCSHFEIFGQVKPELVLPVVHTGGINILQYSHNNKYLLSASDDKTVKIWDINSGKLLHDLKGHIESIVVAEFSNNDEYILTSAYGSTLDDNTARLWNTNTGKVEQVFKHEKGIHYATFNNSNTQVVTCSEDGTVKIWDVKNGKLIQSFGSDDFFSLKKVVFSKDDKTIAVAAFQHISLWDVGSGKQIKKVSGENVDNLEFLQDGKTLLSVNNYDNSIVLWDIQTEFKKRLTLNGIKDNIKTYSVSNNGKYLAVTDMYKTYVWDLTSTNTVAYKIFKGGAGGIIFDNTSNNIIISTGYDAIVNVCSILSGSVISSFKGGDITAWANPFVLSKMSNLISSDNQYLACVKEGTIQLIDFRNGKTFKNFKAHTFQVSTTAVSSKGKYIAVGQAASIKIIDGNTGKISSQISIDREWGPPNKLYFTNDESKLIACKNDTVFVYEVESGKVVQNFLAYERAGFTSSYAAISPNDKRLLTAGNGTLKMWNLENGQLIYKLEMSLTGSKNASFNSDGSLVAVPAYKEILILEVSTGKTIKKFKNPISYFVDCAFSKDGKVLIGADDYKLAYLWDYNSEKMLKQLTKHKSGLNSVAYSNDGNYIISTDRDGGTIIWDAVDASKPSTDPWKDISAKVINQIDLEKNKNVFSVSMCYPKNWMVINANSEIIFYDLQTMKKTITWLGIDEEDYIIYLPNNYYTATPNATRWVNWKIESTLFDFDQWDFKYNRPDIILKSFQNTDTTLISAYEKAYYKRLKKAGLEIDALEDNYHVPDIEVINNNASVITGIQNNIQIKVKANETRKKTSIQKIYVSVNGNPVYGKSGYTINKNTNEVKLDVTLPLNVGNNQIKVSCLNSKGAESLRKKINITYQPTNIAETKTWFIGIGVSKYKNDKYNLTYATKDINDINQLLNTKYKNVQSLLLLNEQATIENIKALNEKLVKEAGPDDIVIISLSGHGLIDNNFNFYFGTYDIDFENPSARGISMDDIESILDKVPATSKLILMDACHSGEIDVDESVLVKSNTDADKNVKTASRSTIKVIRKNNLKSKSSIELLQELFSSNNSTSGSTIISAAGGAEFAYEGPNWNNGVFTYCLLSALKEKTGDLNKDGEITISELQNRVSSQVKILTGGKQKPTSRQINFENDWIIWKR